MFEAFENQKIEKSIKSSQIKDKISKWFTFAVAFLAIAITLLMIGFLIVNSLQTFAKQGVFNFLFGSKWSQHENIYGIFTSLVGSIFTVVGAIALGVPLGVFTAIFISRYTKGKVKIVLRQAVSLFASIPSVIYGFFGVVVVLPWLVSIFQLDTNGKGLLVSILILAIMIVPTIINITINSIDSVDESYYDAATAMGATKNQAVFSVVLQAAKRGVFTAVILGIGKALGEGIALSMIAGNAISMPDGLFTPFNTLTTLIFDELPNATIEGKQALFAAGVVLLLFTIVINFAVNTLNRSPKSGKRSWLKKLLKIQQKPKTIKIKEGQGASVDFSEKKNSAFMANLYFGISVVISLFVLIVFGGMIVHIFAKGLPFINSDVLFRAYSPIAKVTSIWSEIQLTLIMIALSVVICVPLGMLAAIYLTEYANEDKLIIRAIRFSIQVLGSAPGIIIGLLGYMLFVQSQIFSTGYSVLAGVLTMCIISLPTVIKTIENTIKSIPDDYRSASTAMGATKLRTILKIILPCSLTGVFSAIILTISRVVSESAALIFTSGTIRANKITMNGSGATLAVSMYLYAYISGTTEYVNLAYVIGVVILTMIIAINLILLAIELYLTKNGGRKNGKKKA